jgi:hypothetical protein
MNSCNEPIFPELVLATGLWWLAGGSYLDQKDVYSYSQSSYYRIQDIFIDAVLTCDNLDIRFPDFAEDAIVVLFLCGLSFIARLAAC